MTETVDKATPTILVIDDEESILNLLGIILGSRGYHVLTASDGAAGLELTARMQPEVVLLDYMMPVMDGLEVLQTIRRDYPESYVIMFTGKGNEEIAVELMKAGATDYIIKPFNNQSLFDRIENTLRIRAAELENKRLHAERENMLRELDAWNRELENRIQHESAELFRAHEEVVQSQKLATLGYLAAGMAHEIRNPLNSISLFSQLLREGITDPENLEFLDKILKEVDRIDATLRKLLDTAKRPVYALSAVSLKQTIFDALEAFAPQITRHRIEVSFRRIDDLPDLKADPAELAQIFINLFLNAIHEMPDGGKLTIDLQHQNGDAVVQVSDTGSGIPPEHISSIFDPFFTTKSSGSGMGLSVVLRIVKNYGGRIEVANSSSAGTTFQVSLPLPRAVA